MKDRDRPRDGDARGDARGDAPRRDDAMEGRGATAEPPVRRPPRMDPQDRVDLYPAQMPAQHQESPGLEAELRLRPQYEAPAYRAAGKLQGKVALITGGDSGIGRAVAVLYAREGADVAIVYLPVEQRDADETRRAVEAEGRRCLAIPGDVKDPRFCAEAVDRVARELGGLDILVNNAAHQLDKDSLEEITDEEWDVTFRTNIYGYFYVTKHALRHLKEGSAVINTGSITGLEGSKTLRTNVFGYFHMAKAALPHLKEGSCIINTGSVTGLEGSQQLLDYSATKGAIHAFTKSLASNLLPKGIRVNAVAPGPVWTPLNPQSKPAEKVAEFGKDTPMKRPAQPEEIAPAYVFFASTADSSYITGEVLTLLGGETTAG